MPEVVASEELEESQAQCFQRDLYLYWREALNSKGLPLTSRGFVTRPALRSIRARIGSADGISSALTDLPEGEDTRLLFLRRLLERLGLLQRDEHTASSVRLIAADASEMSRYMARPLAERLRMCARLWVAGGWWPDSPDPRTPLPRVMTPAAPRLALTRRSLLETLSHMAVGEEVTLPLKKTTMDLSLSAGSQVKPRERAHRMNRPGAQTLNANETERQALLGPLTWLGFVVPHPASRGKNATSYHICKAVMTLHAEMSVAPLPERHGRLVAQPNFSLVAYPPLTAPLLLALDTCAELSTLDQVARYTLSRSAIARAKQAGMSVADVVDCLQELIGSPLPGNVRVSLADWERSLARVRLTRSVCVLEVEQPTTLDRLLADSGARGWVERRLTPTSALISTDASDNIRIWLLRQGHIPAMKYATMPEPSA